MESTGHIFLIEDEFIINRLVAYALRKLGYDVKTAYTGGKALTQLSEAESEKVALDMELPDIDGQAVLSPYAAKALLSKVILDSGEAAYFLNNSQTNNCLRTSPPFHRLEKLLSYR